jgi:DNA (cytosine-5)-methyltransferase 1
MLKVLDLFSGIGGFSLGLERTGGFETVAFCEIEPFPRKVLAKHWPGVPIYEDVRTLTADTLARDGIGVDVICGGFPCQDISLAGKGAGIDGDRSGLWAEYARLIGELRPRHVLVENVAALLSRGLDRVLGDLAALGFDAEWHCIPAWFIGAPHGRDRVWIIAHPNSDGKPSGAEYAQTPWDGSVSNACDPERRQQPLGVYLARAWRARQPVSWDQVWPGEDSPLGMGVDDGIPERLDRLRALGNAVVPQIPEIIGRAILAAEAAMPVAAE